MIKKHKAKTLEQSNDYQKRLHRVFRQSEDGKELLKIWEAALTMSEGHMFGQDLYNLGRMEGRKEVVREIILQSKQAEGN